MLSGHNEAREQIHPMRPRVGVDVETRVRVVIPLLLVAVDGREHGAVLHVVAVQHIALCAEIPRRPGVQKDGAVLAVIAVQIVMQVVFVVAIIGDRIADGRSRTVHVADDVGIAGLPPAQVDVRRRAAVQRLFHRLVHTVPQLLHRRIQRLCGGQRRLHRRTGPHRG